MCACMLFVSLEGHRPACEEFLGSTVVVRFGGTVTVIFSSMATAISSFSSIVALGTTLGITAVAYHGFENRVGALYYLHNKFGHHCVTESTPQ